MVLDSAPNLTLDYASRKENDGWMKTNRCTFLVMKGWTDDVSVEDCSVR